MARKRFTREQIVAMFREVDVSLSQSEEVRSICRSLGITENTYYRWRQARILAMSGGWIRCKPRPGFHDNAKIFVNFSRVSYTPINPSLYQSSQAVLNAPGIIE